MPDPQSRLQESERHVITRIVMGLIERWECQGCGSTDVPPGMYSHSKGHLRCHGPVVLVKYVRESELRGAVDTGAFESIIHDWTCGCGKGQACPNRGGCREAAEQIAARFGGW